MHKRKRQWDGDVEDRALCPVHWPARLLQGVAWVVFVCFAVRSLTPAVLAAETLGQQSRQVSAAPAKSQLALAAEAQIALENTLDRLNRRLHGRYEYAWQAALAQGHKDHVPPPAAASRADLDALRSQLQTKVAAVKAHQPAVKAVFARTSARLSATQPASVIQQRAHANATKIAQLSKRFDTLLAAIDSAKTDPAYKQAVAAATKFMHAHSSKPKRAKFDPKHLAFDPTGVDARQALTDPAAIRKALGLPVGGTPRATTSVAASATAGAQHGTTTVAASATAGAQHGTTTVPGTGQSLPANLAPTEDVQLTPAIQAKAAALGNNPLNIYEFVRNSVEYLPTYGSIEGSDYTLQTLRGNAMDQASLLIALLRAAHIPARYVYGTIRVPIAQVENWVGNVSDPKAALNLMGQGGIPVLGLAQGGGIKFAQIEHVWVEAQLGYAPSRGAVTRVGATWVPMDPSFKQYTYTEGMDLKTAVAFDAQSFADHIQATSTINTDEGWVQGVDQNYIQSQLDNYQTQLTSYVDTQNPDATVGDVIGTKTIVPETLPLLPASLPYAVTAVASRMAALPANLRWKFHYLVGGQTMVSKSLPSLAGHRLALSYTPATQQDELTLESYIPDNITDASQLPKSLPAGVVALKSEFSIDGETFATGPTYRLGDAITVTKGVYQPNAGWHDRTKTYNAGDYRAVGLDTVGVSQAQLQRLKSRVEATKDALQRGNATGLTKHDVTGAMMQTSLTNYFAQIRARAKMTAQTTGIVSYRMPSFGSISTTSRVDLFFGIPKTITPVGIATDMGRIASIAVSKSGDKQAWVAFNQAVGSANSRAESGVLEEQYNTPIHSQEGLTAVQALATAASQGQRIYTITQANVATAIGELNLPAAVMQDIADSVNAGLTITTSQSTITYNGQLAAGYIILNPITGAAAYKIASGADGGMFVLTFILIVAAFLFALMVISSGAIVVGVLLLVLAAWNFGSWVNAINHADNETEFSQASFKAALSAMLSLVPAGWLYEMAGAEAVALKVIVSLFLTAIAYLFHA